MCIGTHRQDGAKDCPLLSVGILCFVHDDEAVALAEFANSGLAGGRHQDLAGATNHVVERGRIRGTLAH